MPLSRSEAEVSAALPSASELASRLPNWSISLAHDVPSDYPAFGSYEKLRAAAIALASASEADRRALIAEYSRAYCDLLLEYHCIEKEVFNSLAKCHRPPGLPPLPDVPKASGLYVLMRVLFVLPAHVPLAAAPRFSVWLTPWWPREHRMDQDRMTPDVDLSWPIREDPSAHLLVVARGGGSYIFGPDPVYRALAEYDYFAARYPMRTPAMLRALRIELVPARPIVPTSAAPGVLTLLDMWIAYVDRGDWRKKSGTWDDDIDHDDRRRYPPRSP